jgi:hypothetical protein
LGFADYVDGHRDRNEIVYSIDLVRGLTEISGLNLRTQQQLFGRLRLVLQTIPETHYLYAGILAILVWMRHWRPEQYETYLYGTPDVDATIAEIRRLIQASEWGQHDRDRFRFKCEVTLLTYAAEMDWQSEVLEGYRKQAKSGLNDDDQTLQAQGIVGQIDKRYHREGFSPSGLKTTLKRLELTESFHFPSEGAQEE